MPRPYKYFTYNEKAEARKEQTRKAVRAHRERRKLKAALSASESSNNPTQYAWRNGHRPHGVDAEHGSTDVLRQEVFRKIADFATAAATLSVRRVPDFGHYSERAEIELYPGLMRKLIFGLEARQRYPYAQVFEKLGNLDKTVGLGVFGLAAIAYGKLGNNEEAMNHAFAAYNQIIPRVRDLLDKASSSAVYGLLSVVLNHLLIGIELVHNALDPARAKSWLLHYEAGPMVIETCGPKTFRSSLGLAIFKFMRPTIVLQSLICNQHCFLDAEEWRTIPHTDIAADSDDKLWNIIAQLPGLFCRARQLCQLDNVTQEEIMDIWNSFNHVQTTFEMWTSSFLQEHEVVLKLPPLHASWQMGPVSTRDAFPSLYVARQLNDCWFYQFLLHCQVGVYKRNCFGNSTDDTTVPFTAAKLRTITRRLCQTISYLVQHQYVDLQILTHQVSHPLRCLLRHFEQNLHNYDKEYKWCMSMIKHVRQSSSVGLMSEFMLDTLIWERTRRVWPPLGEGEGSLPFSADPEVPRVVFCEDGMDLR